MPDDLADHLLAPDAEVVLALPSIPDDKPQIVLVTTKEVVLGRWNTAGRTVKEITRVRTVPAADVRGVNYSPGLYRSVRIVVDSAPDLSIDPCTAEDAIRFTHALQALAATGALPPPLQPAQVLSALHASGDYAGDSVENRMRAAWDRALRGTANLWNCEAIHSGPALRWLYPGEHTLLVLVGLTGISTQYLAVTDRRVIRGRAPGAKTKDQPIAHARRALYAEGILNDAVRVEMNDGSSLKLKGAINPDEGHEFVDAVNTLVDTGSLPQYLLPFR